MDLLKARRFDEIRSVSRIMRFLYDADEFYRFRAAEAMGYLLRGEKAREFILRLFWHLSDESGAYCIGAPLAIAEIGRTNPEVFDGFKNKYVSLLDNWEVERKYVAYGIGRTAEIVALAYPNPVKKLLEKIHELDSEFVAYAIWALKALRFDVSELVKDFSDDCTPVNFYNGREILHMPLCKLLKLI